MAISKKTVIYPINFGSVLDITTSANTTIGTQTIYIPENTASTVTFTSAMLFVSAQDTVKATGGSITAFTATVTLSGAVASAVTLSTATLANTGENWGGIFGPMDFTSLFNTSFGSGVTGGSKNVTVALRAGITGGIADGIIRATYGHLELTYTYDTSATQRVQTICLPYESSTTTLTNTANTTFATIPILTGATGLLSGYTNVNIRNRWIELRGNCVVNGTTTNFNLSYRFDAGTTFTLPTRVAALASDTYERYLIDALSGITANATHTFQLWNSIASRWPNLVVNEFVTFEYTVAGTTRVLNYVELPFEIPSPVGFNTAVSADTIVRSLDIQEPNPLLVRGAAEINYIATAGAVPTVKIGRQSTFRGYSQVSSVVCGQFSLQHNFDPISAVGLGYTLSTGTNQIPITIFNTTNFMTCTSGILKVLYFSDVSPYGVDAHNRLVYDFIRNQTFTLVSEVFVTNVGLSIPEEKHYIQGFGFINYIWSPAINNVYVAAVTTPSATTTNSVLKNIRSDGYIADGELSYVPWVVRAGDEFRAFPTNNAGNLLDAETLRGYRLGTALSLSAGIKATSVYHTIWSTVSGTVSNTGGNVVNLKLYTNTGSTLLTVSAVTGDSQYQFTVYNSGDTYYVDAYSNGTYKGRSNTGNTTSTFNINLLESQTSGFGGG